MVNVNQDKGGRSMTDEKITLDAINLGTHKVPASLVPEIDKLKPEVRQHIWDYYKLGVEREFSVKKAQFQNKTSKDKTGKLIGFAAIHNEAEVNQAIVDLSKRLLSDCTNKLARQVNKRSSDTVKIKKVEIGSKEHETLVESLEGLSASEILAKLGAVK